MAHSPPIGCSVGWSLFHIAALRCSFSSSLCKAFCKYILSILLYTHIYLFGRRCRQCCYHFKLFLALACSPSLLLSHSHTYIPLWLGGIHTGDDDDATHTKPSHLCFAHVVFSFFLVAVAVELFVVTFKFETIRTRALLFTPPTTTAKKEEENSFFPTEFDLRWDIHHDSQFLCRPFLLMTAYENGGEKRQQNACTHIVHWAHEKFLRFPIQPTNTAIKIFKRGKSERQKKTTTTRKLKNKKMFSFFIFLNKMANVRLWEYTYIILGFSTILSLSFALFQLKREWVSFFLCKLHFVSSDLPSFFLLV